MTSRAVQRMRRIRKQKAGKSRKHDLVVKGTTPPFAQVFESAPAPASRKKSAT